MANPILEALLQKLAERSVTIPPGVNTSFSQPSQSNPYGATFSPALPNPALNFMANRQNPVDLGRIDVVKPPPAQTPQQMPQQQTAPQQMAGAREQGSSAVMTFLKQLGLPIAATIAGVASESALPGAAGFNTGYAASKEKARDRSIEEEKIKETKKEKDVENKREDRKEDIAIRKVVQDGLDTLIKEGLFDPKKQDYQKTIDEQVQDIKERFGLSPQATKVTDNNGYRQEDLEFTAKKHGITPEEVKMRLGIK